MHELIHNNNKAMSIKAYKKMKKKMLDEFCIKLNDEEKWRFNSFTREIDIDNFCITMFRKYV